MTKLSKLLMESLIEGLSFSDYYDESIPNEQKPPIDTLRPNEGIEGKTDIPIDARNRWPRIDENGNGMTPEERQEFDQNLGSLYRELKANLRIETDPVVILVSDQANADKMLGKTGYYDDNKREIHLFITNRHPKDILRSFAHEVIHHWQHENDKFAKSNSKELGPNYAQDDPWLRQMEKQAYLLGNIMFRDWEDKKKAKDKKSGKKNAK